MKQDIGARLAQYADSMAFDGQQRVLDGLLHKPAPQRRGHKRLAVALTFALVLALGGTVFAEVIRQLSVHQIEVTQLDMLPKHDNSAGITTREWSLPGIPRDDEHPEDYTFENMNQWQFVQVTDLNEVRDALFFELKLPKYLPEGFKFVSAQMTKRYPSGTLDGQDAILCFKADGIFREISIQCGYVDNEDISIQTIEDMQPIRVGGVEGLLISFGEPPQYELVWVSDGVLYQMDYPAKDELLRIAESIE